MLDSIKLRNFLLKHATQQYEKGVGFAQEYWVLRIAERELLQEQNSDRLTFEESQFVLNCWQELFIDGILAYGYDLDHSSSPFFRIKSASDITGPCCL